MSGWNGKGEKKVEKIWRLLRHVQSGVRVVGGGIEWSWSALSSRPWEILSLGFSPLRDSLGFSLGLSLAPFPRPLQCSGEPLVKSLAAFFFLQFSSVSVRKTSEFLTIFRSIHAYKTVAWAKVFRTILLNDKAVFYGRLASFVDFLQLQHPRQVFSLRQAKRDDPV